MSLLLAMVFAFAFVACGGGQSSEAVEEETATEEVVEEAAEEIVEEAAEEAVEEATEEADSTATEEAATEE